MFNCPQCNKEFDSSSKLKGHLSSHSRGNKYRELRAANKKPKDTYECIGCGKTCEVGRSKMNKFCSNSCQRDHEWKETKSLIESGDKPATKRYILEIKGNICNSCGIGNEWNGKPLTLHMDHIDGNSDNNSIDNLQILCPNCHTQTETYGSKGKGNRYKKITKRNKYLQEYKAGLT